MLVLQNLSLRRGSKRLLHDVSVVIHHGQKVGLTGRNGVGKSSLFDLILGNLSPDTGDIQLPVQLTVAHVAQEISSSSQSALSYVLEGDARLIDLQKQIIQAEQSDRHELLGELYEKMTQIDGYAAPARASSMLVGLGFSQDELESPVNSFSGGWRVRLNLARALMCPSDILLLDEPTNHLDLEAVVWLESWLREYSGTLLLISHDSTFLDSVVSHIVHVEDCQLKLYTGNYSAFEQARATQLAQNAALFEKQQKDVKRIQDFVSRFGAKATKSRQAQSRLKMLQRMELVAQAHADNAFQFSFLPPKSTADPLLRLEHIDLGYQQHVVLKDISFSIANGARIALLGKNGAGKSTLMKFIAGVQSAQSGQVIAAGNLAIGYFAQHQLEQLDNEASPLLHIQRLDRQVSEQKTRDFLGGFGFVGDRVLEPVGPFSGGEKSRLALALIVYQRPALLLLDEPTNHLDIDTRVALLQALQGFEGAVVLVSHDRQLLSAVADELWVVGEGAVLPYKGDLVSYTEELLASRNLREDRLNENSAGQTGGKKAQRQQSAEMRQKRQPLTNEIKKLERELDRIHSELVKIHQQLADSSIYDEAQKNKLTQLLEQQGKLQSLQQQQEERWLALQDQLELIGKS